MGGDIWGGLRGRERMERLVLVFLPAEPMVPIGLSPRVLGWAMRVLAIYLPTLDPNNFFGSQTRE